MRKYMNTLRSVAWGMHHFGSVATGRALRLRDMRAAEKAGLVSNIGLGLVCDGDGFTIMPERYRDGWILTQEGEDYLRRNDPESYHTHLGKYRVRHTEEERAERLIEQSKQQKEGA